jgi:hypothetical protein
VAQPEYYGLLAARQLEGGRFVQTHLSGPDPVSNLTTWATLTSGGTLRIVIDNLATTGPDQPLRIKIPTYSATAEEALIGPSVEARRGILLGGAPVTTGGRWRPKPVNLSRSQSFRIVVPPASALIVTLSRKLPRR